MGEDDLPCNAQSHNMHLVRGGTFGMAAAGGRGIFLQCLYDRIRDAGSVIPDADRAGMAVQQHGRDCNMAAGRIMADTVSDQVFHGSV